MKLILDTGQEIDLGKVEEQLEEGEAITNVVVCFESVSFEGEGKHNVGIAKSNGISYGTMSGLLHLCRRMVDEQFTRSLQ